jgi:RHS repeat-associated protein
MSVSKPAQGVCFFYDASGERFYKNSGQKQMMLVNGLYYMNIPFYDSPVLYTSPYVVVTRDGYTKHYFVETERFASRIGDGSISGINSHAASSAALAAKQADVDFYAPDSIRPDNFTFLRSMPNHLSAHHTTYWQHSDHLGSASWVTDTNGLGYQHFQYRAWGEPFIEQNSTANGYETRYTFSGKERDEETGYSYFGARHYHSDLSIWLSVDPMSDKFPSTSPYTYCANNPVRLVDPNGEEKIDALANTEENRRKKKACQRYPENDGVIHLWAHGSPNSISLYGISMGVDRVQDIGLYLYLQSSVYQKNYDEKKTSILVLHSCQTGRGENNIAQTISKEYDLLVVAPTKDVHIAVADRDKPWEIDIEAGTYDGTTKDVTGGSITRNITRKGAWNIYYKGVKVDSFDGLSQPIFKNPEKTIKKYEKIYQNIMSHSN